MAGARVLFPRTSRPARPVVQHLLYEEESLLCADKKLPVLPDHNEARSRSLGPVPFSRWNVADLRAHARQGYAGRTAYAGQAAVVKDGVDQLAKHYEGNRKRAGRKGRVLLHGGHLPPGGGGRDLTGSGPSGSVSAASGGGSGASSGGQSPNIHNPFSGQSTTESLGKHAEKMALRRERRRMRDRPLWERTNAFPPKDVPLLEDPEKTGLDPLECSKHAGGGRDRRLQNMEGQINEDRFWRKPGRQRSEGRLWSEFFGGYVGGFWWCGFVLGRIVLSIMSWKKGFHVFGQNVGGRNSSCSTSDTVRCVSSSFPEGDNFVTHLFVVVVVRPRTHPFCTSSFRYYNGNWTQKFLRDDFVHLRHRMEQPTTDATERALLPSPPSATPAIHTRYDDEPARMLHLDHRSRPWQPDHTDLLVDTKAAAKSIGIAHLPTDLTTVGDVDTPRGLWSMDAARGYPVDTLHKPPHFVIPADRRKTFRELTKNDEERCAELERANPNSPKFEPQAGHVKRRTGATGVEAPAASPLSAPYPVAAFEKRRVPDDESSEEEPPFYFSKLDKHQRDLQQAPRTEHERVARNLARAAKKLSKAEGARMTYAFRNGVPQQEKPSLLHATEDFQPPPRKRTKREIVYARNGGYLSPFKKSSQVVGSKKADPPFKTDTKQLNRTQGMVCNIGDDKPHLASRSVFQHEASKTDRSYLDEIFRKIRFVKGSTPRDGSPSDKNTVRFGESARMYNGKAPYGSEGNFDKDAGMEEEEGGYRL